MDDKGNTFYFGGSYDAVEVNYSQFIFQGNFYNPVLQSNQSFYSGSRANYILSWFLKKVELSNGDIIEAKYKQGSSSAFNSFMQNTLINGNNFFPTGYPTSSRLEEANLEVSYSNEISTATMENYVHTTNMTKRAILQNIEVIGKNININYNYFKDSQKLVHLSSINLNYFGRSENITLNQIPLGGTNPRYFLTSLNNNGEIYFFEYDKTDNLPSKTSYGTNDFGFWNGTNYKGPGNSNNFYNATLIKKIIYPGQGYTIFSHEKADISKKGTTDYTLALSEATMARLANKIDFDGENEYKTTYTYKLSNGKSSGILDPQIILGKIINQEIKYSQVQENVINKGTVEYFYSDIISNPDDYSIKKFSTGTSTNYLYFNDNNNREYQRGKLLRKKMFDANNNLLKESTYEYENFLRPESELADLSQTNCTTCKISDENYYVLTSIDRSFSQDHAATMYVPVTPYLLKREVVKDYFNGVQMSSSTDIEYRKSSMFWHPYPVKITTNNNGIFNVSNIFYPGDVLSTSNCYTSNCTFSNAANPGRKMLTYKQMVDDNIHFPILTIDKNNFGKFSLSENIYDRLGINRYRLSSERSSEINSVFTESSFENASVVENIKYEVYDSKDNLLQSRSKTGIPITTLWGYHQTQPIVKIEGATYAQVMEAFNLNPNDVDAYLQLPIVEKSNLDINDIKESELQLALNSFQKSTALKNYMITAYTHDPLIGVKSITPSSGIRESYKYDDSNRLSHVLNSSDNIVKEYNYHYAPRQFFNDAVNKSFTKNDCPSGMISSSLNYSVPAAKYMSIISQADANQQAENEGQNYANANLTCHYPYCTMTPTYLADIYYSSFQEVSSGHVKVILSLPLTNSSGGSTPSWSNGVFIGTLDSPCRPSSYKNISVSTTNGSWNVSIAPSGGITLMSTSGSTPSSSVTLNFEYDKN